MSSAAFAAVGQFSQCLLILLQLLHVSICYPTKNVYLRQWILAPIAVAVTIYVYTKRVYLESLGAYSTGVVVAIQFCFMIHLVYIQRGFPDFWRRVKDENRLPSNFSFRKKIEWMLNLNCGMRKIGWVQEPRHALPPHPNCSRIIFIRSRTFYGLMHFLIKDLLTTYQTGNPAFDHRVHQDIDGPETYIRGQTLSWRIPNILSWGLHVISSLSLPYMVAAVVCVGLGISEPADWPSLFGSFRAAYTVRLFWGKAWHQILRPMLTGIGKFVAHNVCGFNTGTKLSAYIQLYVAFLLSGLIHTAADYMMVGHFTWHSLRFFPLQAAAISFEDFLMWLVKPFLSKIDYRVNRTTGYIWVTLWLCWSGPLWLDPMNAGGFYNSDRGVIYWKILDVWKAYL